MQKIMGNLKMEINFHLKIFKFSYFFFKKKFLIFIFK